MKNLLDHIESPKDVKRISKADLPDLCREIRALIVQVMSINSGHLGASLGAVELAVGLHYVFNGEVDNMVWDVGHQAYAHKILTGRRKQFNTIRQMGGISGFPGRKESKYDPFGTGHSSTSISAILGMAIAKKINGDRSANIAIIGDGSLTGGMAFEALNHLATERVNAIILINDNDMSIDPNVGGLQRHLNQIDQRQNLFINLGLTYHGVYNGNDISEVIRVLNDEALKTGTHVVHFKTKKGFGYRYSEDGNPTHWHAPGKFEVESGIGELGDTSFPKKYQEVVGKTLFDLMNLDESVVVITPAMATGSSLKEIERAFPERFFDVGIAEQHAVTFSAGLAVQNKKPVCVIYSTFLQRGYDQLIHDVALQPLPVIFLVDRAGLVGRDGSTHHGVFDLAYLNAIPNMTLYAPQDENQLAALIKRVGSQAEGPIAIRYPRGNGVLFEEVNENFYCEDAYLKTSGKSNNLIITIGAIGNQVPESKWYDILALIKVKPIDFEKLTALVGKYDKLVMIEDGVERGGIAQTIVTELVKRSIHPLLEVIALPDKFIGHGGQEELYAQLEMDAQNLEKKILSFFG